MEAVEGPEEDIIPALKGWGYYYNGNCRRSPLVADLQCRRSMKKKKTISKFYKFQLIPHFSLPLKCQGLVPSLSTRIRQDLIRRDSRKEQRTPFSFVAFGGGARSCPGNEFARMETLVMMHYLSYVFNGSSLVKIMIPSAEIHFESSIKDYTHRIVPKSSCVRFGQLRIKLIIYVYIVKKRKGFCNFISTLT
ncbi:OLC1v1022003C1 [Oldenlandia corymbosa var. corymbosa]|uniref:OLC1v1022003C1 n=1 Tax=Oldenlandia corymbosa var. corymbosa TaxID=529605 RepID=A0AAV1C0M6_OLDCO|nr:OLC1v1022003C1 [Oldenlandia corymbosa var. corymbosa]